MHDGRTITLPQLGPRADAAATHGPLLRPEGRVLATLEEDGRRRWIRPKPSAGAWWRRRLVVAWVLMAIYSIVPWTTWDGMPTVMFDLVGRKLVFFGLVFRPTESLLFGLVFLSVFVAIFLLTTLFGRVWCGWACPQTVYLEFVYRPLERAFLGRAALGRKMPVAAWRRVAMYAAWLVISAHLANTLLAWFVGAERLSEWIFHATPAAHPVAFAVFAATTLLMLFDFAFFREQLCSLVCPYGRFQSALLDRDSLIVGYDAARGEPRGRRGSRRSGGCDGGCGCDRNGGCGSGRSCAGEGRAHAHHERDPHVIPVGDCVDCRSCVATCPAGIDIRDGLQLECVQCTQCIDACDAVMTKLGRPTGLIRYSSQRSLAGETRRGARMRLVTYPLLLAALVAGIAYLAATRASAAVAIRRTEGTPYVVRAIVGSGDRIESFVRLRIDNRTREARTYRVRGGEGVGLARMATIEVAGDGSGEVDVVVRSVPEDFSRGRRAIELVVEEVEGPGAQAEALVEVGGDSPDEGFREIVRTNVLGPLALAPRAGAEGRDR